MPKRSNSEEPSEQPELKKPQTEEESKEQIIQNAPEFRILITTSIASAIEDPATGIIASLKELVNSVTISEKLQGANERIVTINGSKSQLIEVLGRIADFSAKLNWGKLDPVIPSAPRKTRGKAQASNISTEEEKLRLENNQYSIRTLFPDVLVLKSLTSISTEGVNKLKQFEDTSNATLELSKSQLPSSTERSLLIRGGLDQIKSAVSQIVELLQAESEYLKDSTTVLYVPRVITGIYGHPETFQRQMLNQALAAANPFIIPDGSITLPAGGAASTVLEPNTQQQMQAIPNAEPGDDIAATQGGMQQAQIQAQSATPGQTLTQHIFIPNDMVGAVIGKGGTKINEIRQSSGSMIRINEPNEDQNGVGSGALNSTERMVTITGTPENNQKALYLLYQRIEAERHHHKK